MLVCFWMPGLTLISYKSFLLYVFNFNISSYESSNISDVEDLREMTALYPFLTILLLGYLFKS